MRTRSRLASIVAAILVLQFLVPAVALVLPGKPHRLGWQMYSGIGYHELTAVDQDGEALTVPWEDILPAPRRVELDWTRHLPERLCHHVTADELTVTVGHAKRTVTC